MKLDFFWVLIGIAVYLGTLLLVLFWTRAKSTSEEDGKRQEFFLGRRGQRGLHPVLLLISYAATVYSAFTLIGLPGLVYKHGVGAFGSIVIAQLLQVACVLFFGMALWRRTQEFEGVTSPIEIVSRSYDSRWLGLIVFLATVVFVIPHLTLQLVGIGRLIAGVTGDRVGYVEGVGCILLIMVLYSELGGFRGIVWTDVLQFSLSIIGIAALAWIFVQRSWDGDLGNIADSLRQNGRGDLLTLPGPDGYYTAPMLFSLCVFYGLWPVAHPSSSVRFLAQTSPRGFLWMVVGMALLPILMFTPGLIIGLGGAASHPGLSHSAKIAGTVVMDVIETGGALTMVFGLFYILGSLSAAMSTCDSQALAMGQIVSRDLVKGVLAPKISPKNEMRSARYAIVAVFLIAYIAGMRDSELILRLSIISGAGTAILVPTYLGIRLRRPDKKAAFASIAAGYLAFAVLETLVEPQSFYGFHNSLWAVGTSTLLYLVISARGFIHLRGFPRRI